MIIKAKILNIKKAKSSKYGNPKYHFILRVENPTVINNYLWAETKTNSLCAYKISNHLLNSTALLRGKRKDENFIIDEIIEL